jgi:hypothetical protein
MHRRIGRLDIVVNKRARSSAGSVLDASDDDIETMLRGCSVCNFMKAARPHLTRCSVVHIVSR